MKRSRSILSILLAFVITVGTLCMSMEVKHVDSYAASAKERVETFIGLAAGKAVTNNVVLSSLTQDELQFLGVYLSNFYVPFSTELGTSDSEKLAEQKAKMVQALNSSGINFNEEIATALVDYVVGLTRSNLKNLEFRFSKKYGATEQSDFHVLRMYKDGDNSSAGATGAELELNYYTFLCAMFGVLFDPIAVSMNVYEYVTDESDYVRGESAFITRRYKGNYNTSFTIADNSYSAAESNSQPTYPIGYIGYVDGNGNFVPMFDFITDINHLYTSSEVEDVPESLKYDGKVNTCLTLEDSEGNSPGHDMYTTGFYLCPTASMQAFAECLKSSNILNGYGFSLFDLDPSDVDGATTADELTDILAGDSSSGGISFTNEQVYNMTIYNTKMSVSPFGDIIAMGANHKVIVVPGCMNPYTWVGISKDGVDYSPGMAFNMVNYISMNEYDCGTLLASTSHSMLSDISIYKPGDTVTRDAPVGTSLEAMKPYNDLMTMLDDSSDFVNVGTLNQIGSDPYLDFRSDIVGIRLPVMRGSSSTKTDVSVAGGKRLIYKVESGKWKTEESKDGATEGYFYLGRYGGWSGKDSGILGSIGVIHSDASIGDGDNHMYIFLPHGNFYAAEANKGGGKGIEDPHDLDTNKYAYSDKDGNYTIIDDVDSSRNKTYLWCRDISGIGTDANLAYNHVLSNMVFIDNLGAFGWDTSESTIDYNAINFKSYFDVGGGWLSMWSMGTSNPFASYIDGLKFGNISPELEVTDQAVVSVYTSYAIAGLYKEGYEDNTVCKLGYRINREGLPPIINNPIVLPNSIADDLLKKDIQNWIYYILHPSQGLEYVRQLITNKTNALLVGLHNDIVGTQGVGIITGTTKYRSNYGYVTTPDLSEISWASSLISLYNKFIPVFIIFMLITMLLAYVTGILPIQKCIIGFVIFSAFLLVPVGAINVVVGTSNRIISRIYGDKFIYWAVVQQETYGTAIDQYASGGGDGDYSNYLKFLYQSNAANQGGQSVVVKWQAPKKMASLMLTSEDNSVLNGLQDSALFNGNWLRNNKAFSGQEYMDGASQYLFRDYSDLANFSRFIYKGIKDGVRDSRTFAGTTWTPSTYPELRADIANIPSEVGDYKYTFKGEGRGDQDYSLVLPLSSFIYRDAIEKQSASGYIENMTMNDYIGINQDLFNFSVAMFQPSTSSETFMRLLNENRQDGNDLTEFYSYTNIDFSGLASYALYSESPFYYFSWSLYDQGMNPNSATYSGYRNLLLSSSKGDGEFFYHQGANGNGELLDFMDMRNFFYYIIPYLKMGNDIVDEFDEQYGIFLYEDVPTDEGKWTDPDISSDQSLKYKYWHNLNVARAYEIYTPWLDLMYDCSYAEPEEIEVMGDRIRIEDPLDPRSYPAERQMIFSESEMYDYGLSEGDLTKVEKKILEFNRKCLESMYELLNYYNFSDFSLNTAAAMECTFAFNTVFSESGLFTDNINLYPQTFEIKDFSYDAFLRFILANNTGTSMVQTTDFYTEVVSNSNTLVAVFMIIDDVLSQYILPFMKILFLILMFIGSILLITVTAMKIDPEMRFIKALLKQVFVPLGMFLFVTVGFAWIVSIFMGEGNNSVTMTDTASVQLGDPGMTLLAMCLLNCVCIWLYFSIIKKLWGYIKSDFKKVTSFETGLVGGIVTGAVGFAGGMVAGKAMGNSGSNGYNEEGTGRESQRAASRSAKDNIEEYSEEPTSERVSESRRETARMVESSKDNFARRNEIDDAIENGRRKMNESSQQLADTTKNVAGDMVKDAGKVADAAADVSAKTLRGAGNIAEAGSDAIVRQLNKIK